jgi:heptosyltransferase-2/heptosyltransferase-3
MPDPHPLVCRFGALGDMDLLTPLLKQLYLRSGLLALLSLAHSCISVDTGPAHTAAALNCPLVVLFGKESPQRFRPVSLDSPVQVIQGFASAPDSAPDIGHITVQQAFAGWCDAISGSQPAQ